MRRMTLYIDKERLGKPLAEYLETAKKRYGMKKITMITQMLEEAVKHDALDLFTEEKTI